MNSQLRRNEVINRINNLLKNRFKIEETLIEDVEGKGNSLLDKPYWFTPRDLMYLFFEIEKEFNICIEAEDINSGDFKYIGGIINIIISRSKQNGPA